MEKNIFNLQRVFLMVFATCIFSNRMMAEPISSEQAKRNAMKALMSIQSNSKLKSIRRGVVPKLSLAYAKVQEGDSDPVIYAFNVDHDGGFVITSGDDAAIPVLGYCEQGSFDGENLPPNLQEWLDGYAEEIVLWRKVGVNAIKTTSASVPSTKESVDVLLTSKWGQDSPFNNQCIFNGVRCVTGCVATAMAQVMYYWATTGKDGEVFRPGSPALEADETVTYKYNVEALDAIDSFDWDNMTDDEPKTAESIAAVAQLMRYCGQALRTDYTNGNSSAVTMNVLPSLKKNFRYNLGINMIYPNTNDDDAWCDRIYKDLFNGMPVMMSGGNHAFVCDGYDAENDQFHFNWGWNGRYDGWFAMDALNPGGRDYSSKKSAIVGIQPLEKSMYAIFSDNGKTLTYYCDREKDDRGEKYYQMFRDGTLYTINVPFWSNRDSITKIVIDPSFVDGRPDTVETLFQGMRNLENIVNIQYLNTSNLVYMNGMFRGCSSLKEIDISNFDFSNTISMSSMFENCSSLMNVKLPNRIKCIGEKMFKNCSRLSSIYLPNRIDSIDASAFYGCYDLKSVTVAFRVPPTISKYTFSYRANATLYVPNGSKEAFEAADYWKEFKSIEEYEYYEPGDVNMDGTVEISDVVLMVNYILGNNASETVLKYGDMNESGDIDITDVVAIVNRILGE